MPDHKYTVTVYAAAPGTPLLDETGKQKLDGHGVPETSGPGHMFYVTSDGTNRISNGFAPITQGSPDGPGKIYHSDEMEYSKPLYSRTMEISKDQYDKLNEFAQDPKKFGFDLNYKDVRNNCVDFTWAGLNHAGIKQQNHLDAPLPGLPGPSVRIPLPGHTDGKTSFRPAENVDDIRSIKDPVPGSLLNKEHSNPMPEHRSVLQHLLSEQNPPARLDDPSHAGNAMFRQAHDGIAKLNAEHGVPPSERDKDFAAALAVNARANGLERIDHVKLSEDGSRAFAVQGNLQSAHGLDRQLVQMPTTEALNTPMAQSSARWDQAVQQGQQVQAQAQQQSAQQSVSQQQAIQQPAPARQV